ncbi:hypothetical protein BN2475_150062 [Paraburkholderia ribeironis]|uniref:Uncharacterized protein n=1 Tax=Paraburkholderia ribeironis TaxID=1247936 RepID=A0A1N7RTD6_9BURK|nr:hypothetical protein [Paraburkholderia ribeironis]SIT38382.1 hypothetical protein BN2475_150062 [Paraburkholderia ribeironis]
MLHPQERRVVRRDDGSGAPGARVLLRESIPCRVVVVVVAVVVGVGARVAGFGFGETLASAQRKFRRRCRFAADPFVVAIWSMWSAAMSGAPTRSPNSLSARGDG